MALADGLISFWELEEASGTRVDAHGTNDLADNGGVFSASGVVGDAAANSGGLYLSAASNASLETGDIDFTVGFWVKVLTGLANFICPISKDDGSTHREWTCLVDGSGNVYLFVFNDGGFDDVLVGGLSESTWTFVVLQHDSVNDLIKVSLNGAAPTTKAYGTGVHVTSAPLEVFRGLSGTFGCTGLIDQVGFWKRVLTDDEISALYNGGAGVAYADMAGGGGTTYDETLTLGAVDAAFSPSGRLSIAQTLSMAGLGGVSPAAALTVAQSLTLSAASDASPTRSVDIPGTTSLAAALGMQADQTLTVSQAIALQAAAQLSPSQVAVILALLTLTTGVVLSPGGTLVLEATSALGANAALSFLDSRGFTETLALALTAALTPSAQWALAAQLALDAQSDLQSAVTAQLAANLSVQASASLVQSAIAQMTSALTLAAAAALATVGTQVGANTPDILRMVVTALRGAAFGDVTLGQPTFTDVTVTEGRLGDIDLE